VVLFVFGFIDFISFLSVLCCFLILENNSGYMNSGYGDVRHKAYIWGFSFLDYSFDVLITQISNFDLCNWFCHIFFTCFLIACSCMYVLMTQFSIHDFDTDLSIHVCLSLYTTWHSSCHWLGNFWLPWTLVQILKFRPRWTSEWPELCSDSVVN